ncbi:hypothetical protein RN001_005762 [Aquatica leii]|uniref:Uncharacterized protein n=1 Tax=Aquatica leii TaxID=1421715 RepID=A0AAN7PD56_9COLE|nr:hypothetical protein RN001_005762 [Aquatica leii]
MYCHRTIEKCYCREYCKLCEPDEDQPFCIDSFQLTVVSQQEIDLAVGALFSSSCDKLQSIVTFDSFPDLNQPSTSGTQKLEPPDTNDDDLIVHALKRNPGKIKKLQSSISAVESLQKQGDIKLELKETFYKKKLQLLEAQIKHQEEFDSEILKLDMIIEEAFVDGQVFPSSPSPPPPTCGDDANKSQEIFSDSDCVMQQILATKEENLPIDSTFNVDNKNKQNNRSEQINLSLIEDEHTNAKNDFNNLECDDVDPISLIENAEVVILDNNSRLQNQINVQCCNNSEYNESNVHFDCGEVEVDQDKILAVFEETNFSVNDNIRGEEIIDVQRVNLVDNMEIESEECNVDDPDYIADPIEAEKELRRLAYEEIDKHMVLPGESFNESDDSETEDHIETGIIDSDTDHDVDDEYEEDNESCYYIGSGDEHTNFAEDTKDPGLQTACSKQHGDDDYRANKSTCTNTPTTSVIIGYSGGALGRCNYGGVLAPLRPNKPLSIPFDLRVVGVINLGASTRSPNVSNIEAELNQPWTSNSSNHGYDKRHTDAFTRTRNITKELVGYGVTLQKQFKYVNVIKETEKFVRRFNMHASVTTFNFNAVEDPIQVKQDLQNFENEIHKIRDQMDKIIADVNLEFLEDEMLPHKRPRLHNTLSPDATTNKKRETLEICDLDMIIEEAFVDGQVFPSPPSLPPPTCGEDANKREESRKITKPLSGGGDVPTTFDGDTQASDDNEATAHAAQKEFKNKIKDIHKNNKIKLSVSDRKCTAAKRQRLELETEISKLKIKLEEAQKYYKSVCKKRKQYISEVRQYTVFSSSLQKFTDQSKSSKINGVYWQLCKSTLQAHIMDLKKHANSQINKKNMKKYCMKNKLVQFGVSNVRKAKKICDPKLEIHIAVHSSILTSDNLYETLREVLSSDPVITSKLKLQRKKLQHPPKEAIELLKSPTVQHPSHGDIDDKDGEDSESDYENNSVHSDDDVEEIL